MFRPTKLFQGLNPLFPPQLPIKITIATISLENVHLDEHAQTLSAFLLVQSVTGLCLCIEDYQSCLAYFIIHRRIIHCRLLVGFPTITLQMHQNKRLKWNASEFDGRSELLIPIWEVWTPKFVALNR